MSRRVPENSESSSGKSKEENLASQKTSWDGGKGENLQNEMLARLRIPHSLERKAKLAFFFSLSAVYLTGI